LLDRALTQGPDALDTKQRGLLLRDQLALSELHFQVWTSPAAHSRWIDAQLHPTRRVEVVRAEVHVLAPPAKGDAAAADSVPLPGVVTAQLPSWQG
jgi:hypothetical protein